MSNPGILHYLLTENKGGVVAWVYPRAAVNPQKFNVIMLWIKHFLQGKKSLVENDGAGMLFGTN